MDSTHVKNSLSFSNSGPMFKPASPCGSSDYQRCGPAHRVFFIPVFSLVMQEVIDIFEGVRDDQALRMASNLGFKGPLETQVMQSAGSFHSPRAEEQTHECEIGRAHV